jgi:hypothetical protein
MTKKYITIFSFALILCLALGFSIMKNGPKTDPNPSATITSQTSSTGSVTHTVHGNHNSDNVNSIWSQSFDDTTFPPTGWLNYQESGTGLWTRETSTSYPSGFSPHSGAGMAGFASYTYYATTSASLISASFSLTGGTAKLGFYMLRDGDYSTNADLVNFYVNTTASSTGATLLGTINRSSALSPVETGGNGWYYYEFSIPTTFNTATNYIIMQAVSAYGNDIYLDDVFVSYLLSADVGTYSIDIASPAGTGSQIPKATVKNYGTATQTFPVTMTIGSYTSTKTVTSLTAGSTLQVSFDSWSPTTGTYSVKTYTQLTGDLDRTNDTLTKSVVVQNQITGTWISTAAYTFGAAGGIGACNIPNSTNIFCAGGSGSAMTTNCYLYNPTTNTYTSKSSLPVTRAYGKMVKVRDSLYYVESIGTTFSSPDGALYKYDPTADSWTTKATEPTTIQEGGVVVWKDSLIICIGGSTSGFTSTTNTIMVYNPWTNTWTTLSGTVPTAAMGYSGECIGNEIVIVGGYTGSAMATLCYRGTITATNPISISWREITSPYGQGVYRAATSKLGNYIFFGPSQGTTLTGQLFAFKITDSTTTPCSPSMSPALGNITSMPVIQGTDSTYLFTFGGYSSAISDACWKYAFKNIVTGISSNQTTVPTKYSLSQNYPNPFNPVTKINFALPKAGFVTLKIYDMLGKEVRTLVNEYKTASNYSVEFNASALSSGVYFYKISTNEFTDVKKMMLIK